jgi:hypothetical protein
MNSTDIALARPGTIIRRFDRGSLDREEKAVEPATSATTGKNSVPPAVFMSESERKNDCHLLHLPVLTGG